MHYQLGTLSDSGCEGPSLIGSQTTIGLLQQVQQVGCQFTQPMSLTACQQWQQQPSWWQAHPPHRCTRGRPHRSATDRPGRPAHGL